MNLRGAFGSAAFSAACTLSLLAGGCGTEQVEDAGDFDHARLVEIVDEVTCVPLLAGKNIPAGTVCSSIDNTVDTSQQCWAGSQGVMNVTYQTTGGWQLVHARMALGTGLEDIPTNRRGKARLALYPYSSGDITGATTHTFAVPLCQLGLDASDDSCDGVLAHLSNEAELRKAKPGRPGKFQVKKGWGDGELLGRRWRQGKYYTMQLDCVSDDPPPPPVQVCETAYAHGPAATCFLGADFDGNDQDDGFSNWGWTNGPIAPNTTTSWPVYAAAGGCDPSQGEHVGNVGVTYVGGSATITFERMGDILLDEEQIHVGSQPLPHDAGGSYSINPSDYGFTIDHTAASNTTHTVHGLSGDIYVSYHAIACGDSLAPPADPLASLTDEFETDTLADWSIHRPETADVSVLDGDLVMTPNQFAWWYMGDEALQVSKAVTGNFAVTTRMEVTNLAGEPTVPGAPYRIGGIMVRDPNSNNGPNTYHMGIGNMNTPTVVTVSKSTDEGYSEIGTTPWAGTLAEMRICRFGADVQAFIRLPEYEEQWTMIDSHQRPDLPSTVAVGPVAYAGQAEPDLVAAADYVHFQSVAKLEDCWRD